MFFFSTCAFRKSVELEFREWKRTKTLLILRSLSLAISIDLRILQVMDANKPEWKKLNALRQEQRDIVNRLNLLESDLTETKLVSDALKQVDSERKCFRSQGGILIEQKVKDVIPALEKSKEQLDTMINNAKKEITDKGKAIQDFMREHNLMIRKQ